MDAMVEEKQPGGPGFLLPGFRFHPTEEELLNFYLKKRVHGHNFSHEVIGTLDLYQYDPWQLSALAHHEGEREWFLFVPRDKKMVAGRRSRLTASGYWKATGSDRVVGSQAFQCIGFKKTLVFYTGKAPSGNKTDWIMNEYRLPDCSPSLKKDVVLCRIYKKATSLKTLEQRAAMIRRHHIQQEKGGKELVDSGEGMIHSTLAFDGCSPYPMADMQVPSLNCDNDCELTKDQSLMDDAFSSVDKSSQEFQMEFVMTALEDCKLKKLKPLELEVPKFDVDIFLRPEIVSPWTPSILFSTPNE